MEDFEHFAQVEERLTELMTYIDDIKDSLCSLQYIELTNKIKRIKDLYSHQQDHQLNAIRQAIRLRNSIPSIALAIVEHFTDEF